MHKHNDIKTDDDGQKQSYQVIRIAELSPEYVSMHDIMDKQSYKEILKLIQVQRKKVNELADKVNTLSEYYDAVWQFCKQVMDRLADTMKQVNKLWEFGIWGKRDSKVHKIKRILRGY